MSKEVKHLAHKIPPHFCGRKNNLNLYCFVLVFVLPFYWPRRSKNIQIDRLMVISVKPVLKLVVFTRLLKKEIFRCPSQ